MGEQSTFLHVLLSSVCSFGGPVHPMPRRIAGDRAIPSYNTADLPELRGADIMVVPMEHDCLTSDSLPHITRLYADFLSWRSGKAAPAKLVGLYGQRPDLSGIKSAIRPIKSGAAAYPKEMRAAVVEILRAQNAEFSGTQLPIEVARNLDRLADKAVAIVTGQQVGLFGGPAYTFYKALSALRIVEQLRKSGIDAVPIFWMASEDHDLAEIDHVSWPTANGEERLEWTGDKSLEGRSVGNIALGDAITSLVKRATESLTGADSGEIENILASAYQPGATFGSAFARLMSAIFAKRGLILLDPLDARLHKLSAPLLIRAANEQSELNAALLEQNKRLEKLGYHAQVKVTDRSTLLFATVEGKRVSLTRRNNGFVAGAQEFSASELVSAIAAHPESFSPNALLRPVVQDTLLPTAAYIGGAAEIAYFAQNRALYDRLLGRTPAILPRASFTIVESAVQRLLKRYSLSIQDIFAGRQFFRGKMERQNLPSGLAVRFSSEEKKLTKMLESFRKPIGKLDSTLVGALETAQRSMLCQFEKLRAKSGRAEGFRTGILSRHEQSIRDALYPQNGLQERSLNLLPFLARNGFDLLGEIEEQSGLDCGAHCVIRL
jgi:bacillithiol biosynthesis cysteine-adding enzyme BshC